MTYSDLDASIYAYLLKLPRAMNVATYADLSKALKVPVVRVRASVGRLVDQKKVAVHEHHRRARLRHPGVPGAAGHRYVEHQVYVPYEEK